MPIENSGGEFSIGAKISSVRNVKVIPWLLLGGPLKIYVYFSRNVKVLFCVFCFFEHVIFVPKFPYRVADFTVSGKKRSNTSHKTLTIDFF